MNPAFVQLNRSVTGSFPHRDCCAPDESQVTLLARPPRWSASSDRSSGSWHLGAYRPLVMGIRRHRSPGSWSSSTVPRAPGESPSAAGEGGQHVELGARGQWCDAVVHRDGVQQEAAPGQHPGEIGAVLAGHLVPARRARRPRRAAPRVRCPPRRRAPTRPPAPPRRADLTHRHVARHSGWGTPPADRT